ncbi:GIY-YIG nuclease family protein [Fidelibacter multiformis]|jgi:putative endonuclease|uniref:GIY-YIG nuclease family protein n=1 Tax=Fidelibacter multiformis TaxID=3377529 RepID=UPI0037DCA83C
MYTVYILKSEKTGKLYIGQTNNINKRLWRHQNNMVLSTKNRGPWILIKTIPFENRSQAVQMEYKLKKMKNPQRILSYLSKYG